LFQEYNREKESSQSTGIEIPVLASTYEFCLLGAVFVTIFTLHLHPKVQQLKVVGRKCAEDGESIVLNKMADMLHARKTDR
jgi:hypothetical protein